MSDENKKKIPQGPHAIPRWEHHKQPSKQPKGPAKPWEPEVDAAASEFVEFLKDAGSKQALHDFMMETYRRYEAEKQNQLRARLENEEQVNSRRLAPFHDTGNIAPILSDTLNMVDTEKAFARGLKATQANLIRSVDERVEEINRLLAGLGGFSSQLKSCFARSTVVFLEQEDPRYSFRERLIFSINLPKYELKRSWTEDVEAAKKRAVKKPLGPEDDPRTTLQATWDDAVNALSQIIASTGLKPKYCKNDRHYGRFVMKQDLRSSLNLPDEYFSFTLDYNTQERIKDMCGPYNEVVKEYEKKIAKLEKKLNRYNINDHSPKVVELRKRHLNLVQERDFFVGTTPDPNQLDEGLLFLIEVSTLKDYHVVKDRMQSIMTKYILHLSKLAVKDAAVDPDLEYELWKTGQKEQKAQRAGAHGQNGGPLESLTEEDIESLPEYEIEAGALQPRKKSAA